jgi:hypothetical protein
VIVVKAGQCVLLAAATLVIGCGKQERLEAVRLTKVLTGKQADFAKANTTENDLITSARAWCDGITANGAGRGAELDQNAAVAMELAKYAVAASTQLSQVRQAVDEQSLHEEYPKSVRNALITQLTARQRRLQDLRTLLELAAPQFVQYRHNTAYAGDTYPGEIGKLGGIVAAYRAPDDAVGSAIAGLKAKYKVRGDEL